MILPWFNTQTTPSYEKCQETQDRGGNAMEKTEDMSRASSMSTCQMTMPLVLDMCSGSHSSKFSLALNLVFSLQALSLPSGREVLWLRCSELTVGVDTTSCSAGASQPLLVYCCSCASPASPTVPAACWQKADIEFALI